MRTKNKLVCPDCGTSHKLTKEGIKLLRKLKKKELYCTKCSCDFSFKLHRDKTIDIERIGFSYTFLERVDP